MKKKISHNKKTINKGFEITFDTQTIEDIKKQKQNQSNIENNGFFYC